MEQKIITTYQKKIGSAALLALAILILVVSCPLKRLLSNNAVSKTPTALESKQTKNNQYLSKLYSTNTTCTAQKNETLIFQADNSPHKNAEDHIITINIFNNNGYHFHSFLDGIESEFYIAPAPGYNSIPLFIQHRRLLI